MKKFYTKYNFLYYVLFIWLIIVGCTKTIMSRYNNNNISFTPINLPINPNNKIGINQIFLNPIGYYTPNINSPIYFSVNDTLNISIISNSVCNIDFSLKDGNIYSSTDVINIGNNNLKIFFGKNVPVGYNTLHYIIYKQSYLDYIDSISNIDLSAPIVNKINNFIINSNVINGDTAVNYSFILNAQTPDIIGSIDIRLPNSTNQSETQFFNINENNNLSINYIDDNNYNINFYLHYNNINGNKKYIPNNFQIVIYDKTLIYKSKPFIYYN